MLLRRFLENRAGHFALMTAITAPVAIVLAAVAVDTGSLYVEKRRAQGLADLAAISAASNLATASQRASTAFADNGVTAAQVNNTANLTASGAGNRILVETGRYSPASNVAARARFAAGGAASQNAAKVTYRTIGTRYFGGALIDPPEIVVHAVATSSAAAAFSIGSRLLAVDGGLINALLSGLTGSEISLSVMDYNALVGANVSLLSFLDVLRTDLSLTAGTYEDVLDANITVGQVAKALANSTETTAGVKTALNRMVNQLTNGSALPFKLSDLIDLGDGQITQGSIRQIGADIDVLEFLTLSSVIAGRGKQVALDLGAHVPGILDVSVALAIGEPPQKSPWFTIGEGGELVRTSQTRLSIIVEIGGVGGILGTKVRLPLYLEVAYAEAKLKSVTCPTGRPDSVKVAIDARPGIANLYLAEVDRSKLGGFNNPLVRSPARLIQLPLVTVTGQAQAEISNISTKTLNFTAADIASGKVRKVNTQDYVSSLTQSLFSSLALTVRVELGPLGLPLLTVPAGTLAALGTTIKAATVPIDKVLYTLLSLLGISLGEAEIKVHGATCGRAVLVQ